MGSMSMPNAAPLPRLGEVFFDVRSPSRSLRISWYADTGVAVLSIWQGGTCTGSFRLPMGDLPRMIAALQRGPDGPAAGGNYTSPAAPDQALPGAGDNPPVGRPDPGAAAAAGYGPYAAGPGSLHYLNGSAAGPYPDETGAIYPDNLAPGTTRTAPPRAPPGRPGARAPSRTAQAAARGRLPSNSALARCGRARRCRRDTRMRLTRRYTCPPRPARISRPIRPATRTRPARTRLARTRPARTRPGRTRPARTRPAPTRPAPIHPARTRPARTRRALSRRTIRPGRVGLTARSHQYPGHLMAPRSRG